MALVLQQNTRSPAAQRLDLAFVLFLRGLALIFLAMSLLIWLKVVGFWPGDANRFDTMTPLWRVYAGVLMVVAPVASVGLWTTLAWGRVVWFLLIGFQSVAVLRFPGAFDSHDEIVLFHLATLAIYLLFQIGERFIAKKA